MVIWKCHSVKRKIRYEKNILLTVFCTQGLHLVQTKLLNTSLDRKPINKNYNYSQTITDIDCN